MRGRGGSVPGAGRDDPCAVLLGGWGITHGRTTRSGAAWRASELARRLVRLVRERAKTAQRDALIRQHRHLGLTSLVGETLRDGAIMGRRRHRGAAPNGLLDSAGPPWAQCGVACGGAHPCRPPGGAGGNVGRSSAVDGGGVRGGAATRQRLGPFRSPSPGQYAGPSESALCRTLTARESWAAGAPAPAPATTGAGLRRP